MRWTGDGGFVMPKDNPGIRVEPNFVAQLRPGSGQGGRGRSRSARIEHAGDDRVHTMSAHDGEIKSTSSE